MTEMEKVQRVIALKEAFTVSEELLNELLSQITDANLKQNFQRIARGLKVEDNYRLVYTAMPWVKRVIIKSCGLPKKAYK